MPVEITMPELGESVYEGTVTRWLKKEGDPVKRDEPVVEIMTDKVNTELAAPATGVLSKILVKEGETVEVLKAMGLIETSASANATADTSAPTATGTSAPTATGTSAPTATGTSAPTATGTSAPTATGTSAPTATGASASTSTAAAPVTEVVAEAPIPNGSAAAETAPVEEPADEGHKRWTTPVVKAMVKEHGLSERDLASITGSGEGGRVTKKDIEGYLAAGRPAAPVTAPAATPVASPTQATPAAAPAKAAPTKTTPTTAGADQELVPLVGMRKMIADAMVRAAQVPAVTTVTQVDVTSMVKFRDLNKENFLATYGVKLTYTPFFIKALAETLLEFPLVNASLRDDNQILMNKGVHVGVAVALGKGGDQGLIVPVIRDCHTKGLVEIAKDLDEIAKKARANKLGMEDIKGGTFTLTNPGTYGALFGTPMINAPQGGILGTYAISKQPVIVDDMIAIRSIMHLVLTYDHRLIDGMLAGRKDARLQVANR